MEVSLTEKKLNTGRQLEADAVKFFAVTFMVIVNFYQQLSGYDCEHVFPDSFFRNAIEFIGGPLAEPVFMFAMGIGMIYRRKSTPADLIKHGGILMLTGYLLNFFRHTVQQLIGYAAGIVENPDLIDSFLCVDLLIFSGMAYITVGLMKKIKLFPVHILGISVLLQAAGMWSTKLPMQPGVIQGLIGLFVPTGRLTSFPLTVWLIYPAMGMVFGEFLMKCNDKSKLYGKLMISSAGFFAAFTAGLLYVGYDIRNIYALYEDTYYHQNIVSVLWIAPIIVFVLGACHFLFGKTAERPIGRFIGYCSDNMKIIYIIQWLIIAYTVTAFMLLDIEDIYSPLIIIAGGIVVMAVSVLISVPIVKIKMKMRNKKA
ncbi:MAG: hypothetical protein IJT87_09375 [Ruminiclostridium sp.]|nr:hypothetical protein [Ruminiclostridium sp.]